MVLKKVSSSQKYLFYPKKSVNFVSQNCNIVKVTFIFECIYKCKLFLWWQSWIFSIIMAVFSVTWSFRNQKFRICWWMESL